MSLRTVKFNEDWMKKLDGLGKLTNTWCQKQSDTHVRCIVCFQSISYKVSGFHALRSHANSKKHIENYISIDNQMIISNTTLEDEAGTTRTGLELISKRDIACKAEIIWAMKTVTCNMSAQSNYGIANVFKAMFPSAVPENFSIGPTKLSYIVTECLGPYFRNEMLQDAKNSYYSLLYDETTNAEGEKEMETMLRYWSDQREEIVVTHLETFFLGEAKAENLLHCLNSSLDNADISLHNLLMLGSDGPNVNKKVFRLLNEDVKQIRGKSLLDLGSCNIHIVHNAFIKGLEGSSLNDSSELVIFIYYFFKKWPSRWEDFLKIQCELNLPGHRIIKHVPTRWLTLQLAADRLLEQWDAIYKYFIQFIPTQKPQLISNCYYGKIVKCLKKPVMKAELRFISSISTIFTQFTGKFQLQHPLIHIMYDELKTLLMTLANRVIKSSTLVEINHRLAGIEQKLNLNNSEDFVLLKDLHCGDEVHELLFVENNVVKEEFLGRCMNFFKISCKHILKKSSLSLYPITKYFRFLRPDMRLSSSSGNDVEKVAQILPFKLQSDVLYDEWKCFQQESISAETNNLRLEKYWASIFKLTNLSGGAKYPHLTKIVKAALALSHGNADVERNFSTSARIITEDRAAMTVRTLNARLSVSYGLAKYGRKPELVPITKELISMANLAHAKYKSYLESERAKREEEEVARKAKQIEKEMAEAEAKALHSKRRTITEMQKSLADIRLIAGSKRKVCDKLFEEANKRLKHGIEKNDMDEVNLAQSLLEAATKKREDEKKKIAEAEVVSKKIEKKTSGLITSFFNKKKN